MSWVSRFPGTPGISQMHDGITSCAGRGAARSPRRRPATASPVPRTVRARPRALGGRSAAWAQRGAPGSVRNEQQRERERNCCSSRLISCTSRLWTEKAPSGQVAQRKLACAGHVRLGRTPERGMIILAGPPRPQRGCLTRARIVARTPRSAPQLRTPRSYGRTHLAQFNAGLGTQCGLCHHGLGPGFGHGGSRTESRARGIPGLGGWCQGMGRRAQCPCRLTGDVGRAPLGPHPRAPLPVHSTRPAVEDRATKQLAAGRIGPASPPATPGTSGTSNGE